MAISAVYTEVLEAASAPVAASSPIYNGATDYPSAPGPASSPVYNGATDYPLVALIRNEQITQGDISADRLVNIPIQILSSRYGVDMTMSSISEVYTPSGATAVILGILFEVLQANTVTVPAIVSVGIAAGENDIFAPEMMQNFDAVGDTWGNWLVFSRARAAITGQAIKANITGATATTLVADLHLIGFLV